MKSSRIRHVVLAAATALTCAIAASGTAVAAPSDARSATDRCVVDANDSAKTVDALMNHCTTEQILTLFENAPLGTTPTGTKKISLLPVFQLSGDPLPYPSAQQLTLAQGKLGESLTFTTKNGKPWVYKNYFFGRDVGGPLTPSVSRIDQKPVYAADFSRDFYGVELSLHEYRQLTPGVWIGRDIGGGSEPTSTPTGGAIALS